MLPKQWFQLRLFTAFILMLVAAGFLYLSLRVEVFVSELPPTSVTRYFEQTTQSGYPLTVYRETVAWSETMVGGSLGLARKKKSDPVVTMRWGYAALDLLIAAAILSAAAVVIELLVRKWQTVATFGWRRAPTVVTAGLVLGGVWLANLWPGHMTLSESGVMVRTYGWPCIADVEIDETAPENAALIEKVRNRNVEEWFSPGIAKIGEEITALTSSGHRSRNHFVAEMLCFLALGASEVALWRWRRRACVKIAAA